MFVSIAGIRQHFNDVNVKHHPLWNEGCATNGKSAAYKVFWFQNCLSYSSNFVVLRHLPSDNRQRIAPTHMLVWFLLDNYMDSKMWKSMITSSNGNISVLMALCDGNPTVGGALIFSSICAWTKGWVNNRDAGDLRRYRPHYGVPVIQWIRCAHLVKGNQTIRFHNMFIISQTNIANISTR